MIPLLGLWVYVLRREFSDHFLDLCCRIRGLSSSSLCITCLRVSVQGRDIPEGPCPRVSHVFVGAHQDRSRLIPLWLCVPGCEGLFLVRVSPVCGL